VKVNLETSPAAKLDFPGKLDEVPVRVEAVDNIAKC
jgi:hypothetical protein